MTRAEIAQLWRYPVKSMRGEALSSSRLSAHGFGGDRVHAVLTEHKGSTRPVTARETPRLLAWRATYPFTADAALRPEEPPAAVVTSPSGASWRWGDPRLRHALEDDLGKPVSLARDVAGLYDVANTVLVTTEASRRAFEAELGAPLDVTRFRPNVHLTTNGMPFEELAWTGALLRFASGVTLKLVKPCTRCVVPTRDPRTLEKWPELMRHLAQDHEQRFGIYGRVLVGGRVALGDAVELVPAAAVA